MITSYISTAIRAIGHHLQHFMLNVIGLSVGLAAAILVALYAQNELQVDAHQPNAERTFRVSQFFTSLNMGGPISNYDALNEYKTQSTEIEEIFTLQVTPKLNGDYFKNDNYYKLENVMATTPNLLKFVDINLLRGDLNLALTEPNHLALNETETRRVFGTIDAIGQTIMKGNERYTLAAVFSDLSDNTHFAFEGLSAITEAQPNFRLNNSYTYIRLVANADSEAVLAGLNAFYNDLVYPSQDPGFVSIGLTGLSDIHLYSDSQYEFKPNGSMTVVIVCFSLSFLLISLAAFNFINISVAQSAKRAKEVGVRKALGASKTQIVTQFLIESMLVTLFSFAMACVFVEALLPWFNNMVGRQLVLNYISVFGIYMTLSVLFIGLVAGAYPAFFMSAFTAKQVLSGDLHRGKTATRVRKSLLTIQASLSISLIIGAITLQQQIDHLANLSVGYEKEQRLEVVDLPSNLLFTEKSPGILSRINGIEGIDSVSLIDSSLTRSFNTSSSVTSDNGVLDETVIPFIGVGYNAAETLGLTLIAGRDFNPSFGADWYTRTKENGKASIVITESLAKMAGYTEPQDAIGKQWRAPNNSRGEMTMIITGVIKDLTIGSARESTSPVILICGYTWSNKSNIVARFEPGQYQNVANSISTVVTEELNIYTPTIEKVSENYNALYKEESRVSKIVAIFSGLAIFLTCVGLYGLASFATLRKQKEIAVRKVLGASRLSIVNLIAKEFLTLVFISVLIAYPLTYWVVGDWLANFNERVSQATDVYLLAFIVVLSVTWITVASIALKASSKRPSLILRYE